MLCLVVVIAFMHAFYVQWVCWVFWEEGYQQVMFLPNVLYCANVLVLMFKLFDLYFFPNFFVNSLNIIENLSPKLASQLENITNCPQMVA
jgi:hypothetical protein